MCWGKMAIKLKLIPGGSDIPIKGKSAIYWILQLDTAASIYQT